MHADHPTLNREVAELLAARRADRRAVDALEVRTVAAAVADARSTIDTSALAPAAVELCRFDGELLSVPRCIDVRVLWSRVRRRRTTWDGLVDSDIVFGFPGRESGLVRHVLRARRLAGRPAVRRRQPADDGHARGAVGRRDAVRARRPCARRPARLALRRGRRRAARRSHRRRRRVARRVRTDPRRRRSGCSPIRIRAAISYAGCHSWAIPTTCGDVDGARRARRAADGRRARSARRDRRHGAGQRRGVRRRSSPPTTSTPAASPSPATRSPPG